MRLDNWIFVTGAPRSGTSFVGRILSWPMEVDLVYEPTDPFTGIAGIDRRYVYMPAESDPRHGYGPILARIFDYDFAYRSPPPREKDAWYTLLRKRLIGPRGQPYLWLAKVNPLHKAAVIKDPDGCLLTEYLHRQYAVRPVICIRHPVAFVASYLHYNFPWDLPELTGQPALMRDYFEESADRFDADPNDRLAGAAILWWALNRVLLDQLARHPDWIVVVHEALCASPIDTFRQLYERLDLPWSVRVERAIMRRTSGHNKAEAAEGRTHDHLRNSAALFSLRRGMLSLEERRRVFEITRDVALQIYPEESFDLTAGGAADMGDQFLENSGPGVLDGRRQASM